MNQKPYRVAIFASGSGTNAEAIFKHFRKHPQIEVSLLLCNNPAAGVIDRARNHNIPYRLFDRTQLQHGEVLQWLSDAAITHIVLAGFLWLIPGALVSAYPGRIINIHPALLPKYGGKGMYGMKVHEAVKKTGEHETGITIHKVSEQYDEGAILFQAKCPVEDTDTPESIAQKVHQLEYRHFSEEIEKWILAG